jgi:two-component system OmpR family response regulator
MVAQDHRVVVVADDDEAMRLLCRVNLELEGYQVVEAENGAGIEAAVRGGDVALIILDIHFGNEDGVEIARVMRERHPEVPIAFLSGSVLFGDALAAVSDARIRKPFTLEELIETVHRLARR